MMLFLLKRRLALMAYLFLLLLFSTSSNGQWSDWGNWSECSSSCGGGIMSKMRKCLRTNCTGVSEMYRSCSLKACQSQQNTFSARDKLCSTYDNRYTINSVSLTWRASRNPKEGSESCDYIKCYDQSGIYAMWLPTVNMNGLKCTGSDGAKGVCLSGFCATLGCNGVLGTSKQLSKCLHCLPYTDSDQLFGVCKKFAVTLGTVEGSPVHSLIPNGSTSIMIKFFVSNTVVLQASRSLQMISINSTGDTFDLGGTKFSAIANTSMFARGPLNETINIRVNQVQGNQLNPEFEFYQLVEDVDDTTASNSSSSYGWKYEEFGDCSVTCGTGLEVAHVHCRDSESPDKLLPDSFCLSTAPTAANSEKPYPVVRKCILPVCPPRWKIGKWGICTHICNNGTQTRTVECIRSDENNNDITLADGMCKEPKPPVIQSCNTHSCGRWQVSSWGECSRHCGNRGKRTRSVFCVDDKGRVINSIECHSQTKPVTIQPCDNGPCHYTWTAGTWSTCSSLCGNGTQSRSVQCTTRRGNVIVNESLCRHDSIGRRPETTRSCFNTSSCTKSWIKSVWGECEGVCGFSHQTRTVTCQAFVQDDRNVFRRVVIPDSDCKGLKPQTRRACNRTGCVTWSTGPWGPCSVTCGNGIKTRTVHCVSSATGQNSTGCDNLTKPAIHSSCNTNKCPVCIDDPTLNCTQMKVLYGCHHSAIATACCHTCSIQ